MELTYLRGSRPAVFADSSVVVLGEDTPAPGLHELWQRILAGDDVGAVIGVLAAGVGGRLLDLPAFAMVVLDPGGARVVVRGHLTVRVGTPDGPVEVSGAGVSTWTERWLPGASGATVGSIDHTVPSDGWLPLLGGIVHADAVRCGAPLADPVAPRPAPAVVEVPPEAIPTPEPARPNSPQPKRAPDTEPVSESVPEATPEPEPAPEPTLHSTAGSEETLAGTVNEYDHLFGPTIHRRIEDAAVRPDEEDEGSGLISAVPGFTSTTSTAVDDDMTISRPQLAAARDAAAGPLPSVSGPGGTLVLARTCSAGHPNPPQRGDCWVCGAAVTGDGTQLPRPALGRLRLSTGAVVELDQDVVIGRLPEARRVTDLPRLVTVPSPTEEISRSHLEVRLEDWHVLAIDPGSTNGTELHRAGEEPYQISREKPSFLRSGDVLDLGDGVTIRVEGLP